MKLALFFFALSLAGWAVAYFGYIRPKWTEFRHVMGITPLLETDAAPLTFSQRVGLRLRGIKGTVLAFATWLVTSLTALLDAMDPSFLAPIKDSAVWQGIGGQNFALRAVSFVTLAIAFLSIRGQVRAAKQLPNPPAPPPMPQNG